MSRFHDDAIVLARHDYSETSQTLMLFTRHHGKIRAIAKGVKRGTKARFAVGIDLLDVGFMNLSNRSGHAEGLGTLTEWKQTRSLTGLREKLFRIHAAQYAADITARLTEDGDPHPKLFDELIVQLDKLAVASEPFESLFQFQVALLSETGSWPRFDRCIRCDRGNELPYFSSLEGGMFCESCAVELRERHRVSPATFQICRSVERDPTDAEDLRSETVAGDASRLVGPFRLLNYHISHLMGRESVMASKLLTKIQT